MKFVVIMVSVAGLLTAGSATASDRITDAQYLKAARCNGLASSVSGVVDADALGSFVKSASAQRSVYVLDRADQEFDKGKRDGRVSDKSKATAELTGACQAYLGDGSNVAKAASAREKTSER